ncbi:hypothetical protein BGZ63DRAFT_408615 [Mariannaea sp. PMI_226]|nr:hypothetical protein BGZ63DRAFT_408615 [Mariannaea sp. PMI_226]
MGSEGAAEAYLSLGKVPIPVFGKYCQVGDAWCHTARSTWSAGTQENTSALQQQPHHTSILSPSQTNSTAPTSLPPPGDRSVLLLHSDLISSCDTAIDCHEKPSLLPPPPPNYIYLADSQPETASPLRGAKRFHPQPRDHLQDC